MIKYNIYKLENEKELKEFDATIQANRIKEDLQGIDEKKELKKQFSIIYKGLVFISIFSNIMFLFN